MNDDLIKLSLVMYVIEKFFNVWARFIMTSISVYLMCTSIIIMFPYWPHPQAHSQLFNVTCCHGNEPGNEAVSCKVAYGMHSYVLSITSY